MFIESENFPIKINNEVDKTPLDDGERKYCIISNVMTMTEQDPDSQVPHWR
jgi:hypothetical protein